MKTQEFLISLAIGSGIMTTPCFARVRQIGPDRYAMAVRHADRPVTTYAAARQVVSRIDSAALEVCGVSSSSLRDVRLATRRSPCWRDAMAGAMARVDDPMVRDAYRQRTGN